MDRFALFVDAGHLLAEGGSVCCGTKKRSSIHCDYRGLIEALSTFCNEQCGLPILRTYWYDGAKDAVPSPEQLLIAELPRTKLRLGRLSGGKQKGVDSLIIRDLMTLARERAVATAFLLGGDEDLREGILAAQEMGVAVNVLGIPTAQTNQSNQAGSLIREADQHLMVPTAFLSRFFSRASAASMEAQRLAPSAPAGASESEAVANAAMLFVASWWQSNGETEIEALLRQAPVIPKALDAELLNSIEAALGISLRARDDLRKDARSAFWSLIRYLAPAPVTS